MPTYFDKKEQVLEVELTQYGKHLLSKGEFSPSYYSFFDDDIIYDSEYAGAEEEQNYSENRILEETPNTRVQYVFSDREDAIVEINDHIRNNRINIRDKKAQATPDKHYAWSAPLGKSTHINSHAPSWNVASLLGQMSSTVKYQQGAQPTLKIPQIKMDNYVCRTEVFTDNLASTSVTDGNQAYQAGEIGAVGSSSDLAINTLQFPDGSFLNITCDEILLEIEEENTDCLKENFDIEVYIVEEVDTDGKAATPGHSANGKTEKLIPLKFAKRFNNIIDGILLDTVPPPNRYDYDPTYVEHYLEIQVDKDIDKEIICRAGIQPSSVKCGGFTRDFLDCEDNARIVGKIYKQVQQDDSGEDC